jgi:hypothetical protein
VAAVIRSPSDDLAVQHLGLRVAYGALRPKPRHSFDLQTFARS